MAIPTDAYRPPDLPRLRYVNLMCEYGRTLTRDCAESANCNAACTVKVVPGCDRRMLPDLEDTRFIATRRCEKLPRGCDPVPFANAGISPQFQVIEVSEHCEVPYPGTGPKPHPSDANEERPADPGGPVNLPAKESVEQGTSHRPRKECRNHECGVPKLTAHLSEVSRRQGEGRVPTR